MILSENSRAPGDAVGRAKEWRALKRQNTSAVLNHDRDLL